MLNKPIKSTQSFLLSTYFAEGLRVSIGLLVPALVMAYFGRLQLGVTLSLGVLCVSIVDTPGPIRHRRNAMMVTTILIFIFSLLVGLTNHSSVMVAILLAASSFIFSMFVLYGARAAAVGVAVLLVMVVNIDDVRPWQQVIVSSFLMLIGGTWYTIWSYSVYQIKPYRMAQQLLSESITEIAKYMEIKADFYKKEVDYEGNFAKLLKVQILVHEKQDEVREMLFKTRTSIKDSTPEGRFLLMVFVDTIDLFEQIMSTYYDYRSLHHQFDQYGILDSFESVIRKSAELLEKVSNALQTGDTPIFNNDLLHEASEIKNKIASIEKQYQTDELKNMGIIALKNIEQNVENILARLKTIVNYFNKDEKKNIQARNIDAKQFVSSQKFDKDLLIENLTFKSVVFRHAVRVSIVMLLGFIVSRLLVTYQSWASYSYWILLTILVISKPGFSVTKKRNYERIVGTVIGGLVSMLIFVYVKDKNFLFVILLVCMVGAYSFHRKNYAISVFFLTPFTLILFDFLNLGGLSVVRERIYDTLIGSTIAIVASYFLFPNWEQVKLKKASINILKANLNYYQEITKIYFENIQDITAYKVARKQVYVNTANLASVFQRMLSEPKSKQLFVQDLHKFTSLNYLLSSYMASLSLYHKDYQYQLNDYQELKPIAQNTIALLKYAIDTISQKNTNKDNKPIMIHQIDNYTHRTTEEISIIEQFNLIQKITYDICKITEKIEL